MKIFQVSAWDISLLVVNGQAILGVLRFHTIASECVNSYMYSKWFHSEDKHFSVSLSLSTDNIIQLQIQIFIPSIMVPVPTLKSTGSWSSLILTITFQWCTPRSSHSICKQSRKTEIQVDRHQVSIMLWNRTAKGLQL